MTFEASSSPVSISVITPVLNGLPYMRQMLACLKSQTRSDWEHIIVDGGSEDGSLELAEQWAGENMHVCLIKAPGLGLYPSILAGLDRAQGALLAWLNADDLYAPWALEVMLAAYARGGSDWLTGFPGCWDDKGQLRFLRPYGWYPQRLIASGWFHSELLGCLQQESMFFSKDLYARLSDTQREKIAACDLAGDFLMWRLFARMAKLKIVPTVVSGFRVTGENRSVVGADRYMNEVWRAGGKKTPRLIGRQLGRVFRTLSAQVALKHIEREDILVHDKST